MRRTKTVDVNGEVKGPPKIKWINNGGSHTLRGGKKIAHGEDFMATPDEIPQAFRDKIVPANPESAAALSNEPELNVAVAGYSLRETNPGWYEIVDDDGKVVSEKPMPKSRAEEVLAHYR